jgi:uncharacterized SAM-binding protein YcdF (DUF218 family)
MNATVLFNKVVGAVLLPPLNLILVTVLGLLLRRRWPRTGLAIGLGGLSLLVVFSTGAGARLLVAPLESMSAPLVPAAASGAGAIVVLGGGRIENAPEYGWRDIPDNIAFLRVHYAAQLHRKTGLPLLATGGTPDGSTLSEAAVMARSLEDDYGVPVRWLEERSNNTAQNAQYSAPILREAGIRRILLVTDAIHMPRSRAVFERAGLEVVPAPTAFLGNGALGANDFIPRGEGLRRTHYAMHEWIGMLWYRLRYGA